VYHLAGMISIRRGDEELVRRVNVDGTRNVIAAARTAGVRRLVYTSSIHALERPPHGVPIDERLAFDPGNPAGEYDRSKAAASVEVLRAVERGLDAVIVCPTGIIGPHDYRISEVGHMVLSWLKPRPHMMIRGHFDFVDVRDVARGLILAANKGRRGEVYILSGERMGIGRILQHVVESAGKRVRAIYVPGRLVLLWARATAPILRLFGATPRFTPYALETVLGNSDISSAKARRELGYTSTPLSRTIADTVAWWQDHPGVSTQRRWFGRVAVVTGASGGIGAAVARRLAAEGMRVVMIARRGGHLEAVARQIREAGGRADVVVADLCDEESARRIYDYVKDTYGGADVLVNNAGMGWYGYSSRMPLDTASQMLKVNTNALVMLTLRFLPSMMSRGRGHIVNIGSVAGSIPSQGIALYAATKAFMDAFTTGVFRETRNTPVRVSVLRAGPVASDFFGAMARRSEGRRIFAEKMAIPCATVAHSVWSLLQRPRRVAYVPRGLRVVPWIELTFGWLMDLIGPALLRKRSASA